LQFPLESKVLADYQQYTDQLAAWHLPGGPVGPPARWASAANVEVGQST